MIPHQANIRIIEAIAKRLDLPMERVIVTIATQANTSAASVPLALDTGIRDGRVKRGQLLLLEAFGGGFTWGSALRFDARSATLLNFAIERRPSTVRRQIPTGLPATITRCAPPPPKKTPRGTRGV